MKQISQSDLISLLDQLDVLLEECEQDERQSNNTSASA